MNITEILFNITDLLVVRLQTLYNARDAKVVVSLGAVQRPEKQTL